MMVVYCIICATRQWSPPLGDLYFSLSVFGPSVCLCGLRGGRDCIFVFGFFCKRVLTNIADDNQPCDFYVSCFISIFVQEIPFDA